MKHEPTTEYRTQFGEFIPEKTEMEPGVVYVALAYATTNHLCACGCGCETVVPLNGTGWSFIEDGDGPTIRPSILNQSCRAHYYITKGKVEML